MSLTAEVAQNVRKGILIFLGNEFTLQLDHNFARTHREEYMVFLELVKKLRQKTFDDRKGAWNIPVADDAIRCLQQFVEWGITPTKSARERLSIELKKLAETAAILQASTETEVHLTIPGEHGSRLVEAMKNYQRGGVKFMSAVERFYNGDEMGLGKSLQLLATLEMKLAYPALILCPSKLKQNWINECSKWIPHRSASMLPNALADVTVMAYSEIHNHVNYGLAGTKKEREAAKAEAKKRKFFFPDIVRPVAVACDEGHWIKHATSRRTQCAITIATESNSRIRGVLSGTPIENGKPSEMIAPLTFLGRMEAMGGWHHYVTRWCGGKRNGFRWDISGATNTKEFHEKLEQVCYIRRRKKEVLKELPDKIPTVIDVELSNRAEYDRANRDIMAELLNRRGRLATAGESGAQGLVKLAILRELVGRGKLPWIIDWVDTFLEDGPKFILYANSIAVQHGLVEGLKKWNPAIVLGGCDDVNSQEKKFMTDPTCRLFIGSVKAAGFGLNLTVASHVGLAELEWTDSKHQQVIDRAHRIGQKDCVNAYYFLARNTIDDDMWEVVSKKAQINSEAVDGEEQAKSEVLANLERKLATRN